MEFLREIAHLRSRGNTFAAVFRVRKPCRRPSTVLSGQWILRSIQPIITTSDAEGAGAMFGVTTFDLECSAAHRRTADGFEKDFFARQAFLTVSGQLEAEMFALAFSNVYTFGPTFRAENSNTPRHLAEFWMVEPEMAFAIWTISGIRGAVPKAIIATCSTAAPDDMEFFNKRIDNTVIETLEHVVNSEFEHLPYTEAIRILEDAARKGAPGSFPVLGHAICKVSTSGI